MIWYLVKGIALETDCGDLPMIPLYADGKYIMRKFIISVATSGHFQSLGELSFFNRSFVTNEISR